MNLLLAFVGVICAIRTASSQLQCMPEDGDTYGSFGNAMPYDRVRGDFKDENACPIVQMWMLIRHGTRYFMEDSLVPMKKATHLRNQILANYAQSRPKGGLCDEVLEALRNWKWDAGSELKLSELAAQGELDMQQLAKRHLERYPLVFGGGEYDPSKFYFRHTNTNRTRDSCRAFVDGVFGRGSAHDGRVRIEAPIEPDMVIKPFTSCAAFDEVRLRKGGPREFRDVVKSAPYANLMKEVSRRIGFADERILNDEELKGLYFNCRYDTALRPAELSPWCLVFTREELAVLEYRTDLYFYYMSGPGTEYGAQLGCAPLKHLRDTFAETVEGNDTGNNRVVALFSHDLVLDMALTALGHYDGQERLPGVEYDYESLKARKYRTSFNLPPAANLVAALHRCGEGNYTVQLILNEKPLNVKGCSEGHCTWEQLKNILPQVEECNFDICNETENARKGVA